MRHSPFLEMSAKEDEEGGYSYRVHLHQKLVIEQGAISSQKLRCVISCGDGSGEGRGHVRGQHSSKQLCGGPVAHGVFGGGRASAMAPAAAQRTHTPHGAQSEHESGSKRRRLGDPCNTRVLLHFWSFAADFQKDYRRGHDDSIAPCVVFKYLQQVFSSNYEQPCNLSRFVPVPTVIAPPRMLSRVLPLGHRNQLHSTYAAHCLRPPSLSSGGIRMCFRGQSAACNMFHRHHRRSPPHGCRMGK